MNLVDTEGKPLNESQKLARLIYDGMNTYAENAIEFDIHPAKFAFTCPALQLCSEAGEFAGKLAKAQRDNDGAISEEVKGAMIKELGDVLWYVMKCGDDLGVTLGDIALINLMKLMDRQKRGTLSGSGDDR